MAPAHEDFMEALDPIAPESLAYETDDGWTCYLHRCPPKAGSSGEPVIVAHGLGFNRFILDYRGTESIVGALRRAGFEVWLLEHRADSSARPPPLARAFDVDTLAVQDVPSAIRKVLERTGAIRVAWVGHGLGGQLLYMHLASEPQSPIFAAATLGSAVRFPPHRSVARRAALVSRLLPGRLSIPNRQLLRLLSPVFPRPGTPLEGPLIRGLMNHAAEDLEVGMVAQVARWIASGTLCDAHDRLDYLEALSGPDFPLLVVSSEGDDLAPPEMASPVLEAWKGPRKLLIPPENPGHLALVQGGAPSEATWRCVAEWLASWRKAAWY